MLSIGPKYKIAKRLRAPIFEKTQSAKFNRAKDKDKGGRIGGKSKRPKALSGYGKQLIEKQKMRYTYGLHEKQFSNYVAKAVRSTGSVPTDNLYSLVEHRLDNVVYRIGLAHTRSLARQLVSHGHILVNGRKVTIPSCMLRMGDIVSIQIGSVEKKVFTRLDEEGREKASVPAWLSYDEKKKEGTVTGDPAYIPGNELFDIALVLEHYSR